MRRPTSRRRSVAYAVAASMTAVLISAAAAAGDHPKRSSDPYAEIRASLPPIPAEIAKTDVPPIPRATQGEPAPWPPIPDDGSLFVHYGEEHWNDAEDVTPEILKVIERHVREFTPFEVYAKALHELYRRQPPTEEQWLAHHVGVMLPALEAWLAGHHLPPLALWDGTRPAPWDSTRDIPLEPALDGSFTGVASLDQLGEALRDRHAAVAVIAQELSGPVKAPFSYRFWGYLRWAKLLRDRYPKARIVQGDAYTLRDTLWNVLAAPAAAIVSGLPLVTKPMMTRLKLIRDAFAALAPGGPFVQFTYSVAPPIPRSLPGVSTEASERIWMNLPPARVWVYRKG